MKMRFLSKSSSPSTRFLHTRYAYSYKHGWLVYCRIDVTRVSNLMSYIRSVRRECAAVHVGHCTSAWDAMRLAMYSTDLHTHAHAILPNLPVSTTIRLVHIALLLVIFIVLKVYTTDRIMILKKNSLFWDNESKTIYKSKKKMSWYSS